MAVLPIVNYPDPRLREETKPVESFGEDLAKLVEDMGDTMRDADGAGLAAPQVGVPLKLFLIEGEIATGDEDSAPVVFANPEILNLSEEAQTGDEGCLSFPGVFSPIRRAMTTKVRAQTPKASGLNWKAQNCCHGPFSTSTTI